MSTFNREPLDHLEIMARRTIPGDFTERLEQSLAVAWPFLLG